MHYRERFRKEINVVGHRFASIAFVVAHFARRVFIAAIATENTPDQSTLCPIEPFPPR